MEGRPAPPFREYSRGMASENANDCAARGLLRCRQGRMPDTPLRRSVFPARSRACVGHSLSPSRVRREEKSPPYATAIATASSNQLRALRTHRLRLPASPCHLSPLPSNFDGFLSRGIDLVVPAPGILEVDSDRGALTLLDFLPREITHTNALSPFDSSKVDGLR